MIEGREDGCEDGIEDGLVDGSEDGTELGAVLGCEDGCEDGWEVGTPSINLCPISSTIHRNADKTALTFIFNSRATDSC
jgi:hypothetical protein